MMTGAARRSRWRMYEFGWSDVTRLLPRVHVPVIDRTGDGRRCLSQPPTECR